MAISGNFKDVHLVPVFQKDLPAVWKLLSDLNPDQSAESSVEPSTAPLARSQAWSEAELVALHGMCKPVQRAILRRIARAGAASQPATYEDLRAAGALASKISEFSFDNVRGNLAWISKYGIKVKGSKSWPFHFSDQGAGRPAGERYEYLMDKAIAELWLEIAGKA
jgi:hypothetical protein